MKNFSELKFSDDFMFGKVMEDRNICKSVLETLLQQSIKEITLPVRQGEIKMTADGHAIRLDIVTMDEVGNVYDTEMQNSNKNSSRIKKQLPKRSRYYQALMDTSFQLESGCDYSSMKECNVIFICTFDPFDKGKYVYTFTNLCIQKPSLKLEDGTRKIFFNTTAELSDAPEDIKRLFEYIQTNKVSDRLTGSIQEKVDYLRSDAAVREGYMKTYIREIEKWNEGYDEGKVTMAYKLYKEGIITAEKAAEENDIDVEEFLKWGEEIIKDNKE